MTIRMCQLLFDARAEKWFFLLFCFLPPAATPNRRFCKRWKSGQGDTTYGMSKSAVLNRNKVKAKFYGVAILSKCSARTRVNTTYVFAQQQPCQAEIWLPKQNKKVKGKAKTKLYSPVGSTRYHPIQRETPQRVLSSIGGRSRRKLYASASRRQTLLTGEHFYLFSLDVHPAWHPACMRLRRTQGALSARSVFRQAPTDSFPWMHKP